MDTIYDEMKRHTMLERSDSHPDLCYETVLQDYKRNELTDTMFFTYPSKAIIAHHIGNEFAFACATKGRANGLTHIYYISDAYNMNAASDSDVTIEGPIRARFVFSHRLNKYRLVAIAEEPATILSTAGSLIERTYVRMRSSYFAGKPRR